MKIEAATALPTLSDLSLPPAVEAARRTEAGPAFSAAVANAGPVPDALSRGAAAARADPLREFEGFVLRMFVESMLPKDNESFFGGGTAGEVWRSMMAEKLGDELAASGGIGIAELLAGRPASVAE